MANAEIIFNSKKGYADVNGAPPDENDSILFQAEYSSKARLTHRQTLDHILRRWQNEIESV